MSPEHSNKIRRHKYIFYDNFLGRAFSHNSKTFPAMTAMRSLFLAAFIALFAASANAQMRVRDLAHIGDIDEPHFKPIVRARHLKTPKSEKSPTNKTPKSEKSPTNKTPKSEKSPTIKSTKKSKTNDSVKSTKKSSTDKTPKSSKINTTSRRMI